MPQPELNGISRSKYSRSSSQICPTPEEELLNALEDNDWREVKNLVRSNRDLLEYKYDCDKTPLLLACTREQITEETVQVLLDEGADIKVICQGLNALHYAAQRADPAILEEITKKISISDINIPSEFGANALQILIRSPQATKANVYKCAQILIDKGISLQYTDTHNRTAEYWAIKKGYTDVVDLIHNATQSGTFRQIEGDNNNEEKLFSYLKQGKQREFLNELNDAKVRGVNIDVNQSDTHSTLLQLACEKNLTRVVERLLEEHASPSMLGPSNSKTPIEIATIQGNSIVLQRLLDNGAKVTSADLNRSLQYADSSNIQACSTVLLNHIIDSGKKLDENSILATLNCVEDEPKCSPLHYAVRYSDNVTTLQLLAHGASLGSKNEYGIMPIEDIDLHVLEQHLDSCIKTNGSKRPDDLKVTFNYRSLVPPYVRLSDNEDQATDVEKCLDPKYTNQLVNETEVIYYMSNTPEMRELLKHPVIKSFLDMKWRQIQWLFWTNFSFYTLFLISLTVYIFTGYVDLSSEKVPGINIAAAISYFILIITLILLFLRELFQMIINPKKYFMASENYAELLLIFIAIYITFVTETLPVRKQLSSVAILLAAFELILILGQHPYFSTNIVMLKTVSYNFFKFLAWYAFLLLAFALSFFLLFTPASISEKSVGNKTDEGKEEEDTFFDSPYRSVFKTIIMLTGEFDAGSINFRTFPITSQLVFALFIFMIAIILLNLLNGLAVSDTQSIQNDAELFGLVARTQHIRHVESLFMGNLLPANFINKITEFCCCLADMNQAQWKKNGTFGHYVCLFPTQLDYKLVFEPNNHGKVVFKHNVGSCHGCSKVSLDKKTIIRTKDIIRTRSENTNVDLQKLSNYIDEKIRNALKTLLDSINNTHNT